MDGVGGGRGCPVAHWPEEGVADKTRDVYYALTFSHMPTTKPKPVLSNLEFCRNNTIQPSGFGQKHINFSKVNFPSSEYS